MGSRCKKRATNTSTSEQCEIDVVKQRKSTYVIQMKDVPRDTAYAIIYWNVVAGLFLVSLAASSVVRRTHQYDVLILEAGRNYQVDPRLVSAVIWKESRYKPTALGKAGEIGLMQVGEAAALDWAKANQVTDFKKQDLWSPKTNVLAGTWYLGRAIRRWQEKNCKDPLPFALSEYNAGRKPTEGWFATSGTQAARFVEEIDYKTTKKYVQDILQRYRGKV